MIEHVKTIKIFKSNTPYYFKFFILLDYGSSYRSKSFCFSDELLPSLEFHNVERTLNKLQLFKDHMLVSNARYDLIHTSTCDKLIDVLDEVPELLL